MGRNAREHRFPTLRARARPEGEPPVVEGGFEGFARARLWLACRVTRVAAGAERANSRLRESVSSDTPRVRARCAHVAETATTTSLVIGTSRRRRRCRPATGTESPRSGPHRTTCEYTIPAGPSFRTSATSYRSIRWRSVRGLFPFCFRPDEIPVSTHCPDISSRHLDNHWSVEVHLSQTYLFVSERTMTALYKRGRYYCTLHLAAFKINHQGFEGNEKKRIRLISRKYIIIESCLSNIRIDVYE